MGYVDSNYAENLDDGRLTTSYVVTLASGPICWKSMIQSLVAQSTIEVEYIVMVEATNEALWLTRMVEELGVHRGGVEMKCDS